VLHVRVEVVAAEDAATAEIAVVAEAVVVARF
jgi:hypothetical protein